MGPNGGTEHVILYCALTRGSLMLVECRDGSFRLLHDERPVPGCHWESHEIELAALKFREVAARLKGQPGRGRGGN